PAAQPFARSPEVATRERSDRAAEGFTAKKRPRQGAGSAAQRHPGGAARDLERQLPGVDRRPAPAGDDRRAGPGPLEAGPASLAQRFVDAR
ncbi:hypothetical protein DOT98_15690, partial [Clavibacter michiganensis subsp. michiganensis]|nr:hypothetical protein [Clavibacter michiganensis subsp. michiganensis]